MHEAEKLAFQLDDEESARSGEPARHVYQVWQDGEITFQKGGDLLWKRNLHTLVPANRSHIRGLIFPHKSGSNTFAYVSRKEAFMIRALVGPDDGMNKDFWSIPE